MRKANMRNPLLVALSVTRRVLAKPCRPNRAQVRLMQASLPARRRLIGKPFGFILLGWIVIVVVLAAMIGFTDSLRYRDWTTEAFFFWRQDAPVLTACVGLATLLWLAPAAWLARAAWRPGRLSERTLILLLAALCLIAGAAGVSLVFCNFSFSLDEFLANFDAKIFASGRLMARVPPAWSDYTSSLQPMYMLPLPDNVWASSYLPVNAGLRAIGRLAHAEWLVNPLLSAFSIVAVYAIGRRLWPDRPAVAPIAAVLLGTSAQLIVMSMTAYAMPAHLAFNLAWLWLFLRGGRAGHAGAIAIGFLATGLHQLLFHPVFVAPFVLQLWLRRRWGLGALYTLAYGAIVLFWVEYWPLASLVSGVAGGDGGSTGGAFFVDRVTEVLDRIYWRNIGVMAQCLVRFVSWQNLLTAPLFLIGAVWSLRTKGALRPLVLGVILTVIATFVATPTQTHGWGYRYLHGLMGSICLVAAWGWSRLTEALPPEKRAAAAGGLAAACAISLLVLAPIRALQAWAYVRPYAAANAAVQSAKADVVVIDHNSQVLFDMGTLVRNDPLLVHNPKVMALADMDDDTVRELCAQHSVLVFNGRTAAAYGIDIVPWRGPLDIARRRALMKQLGCYHLMPPPR